MSSSTDNTIHPQACEDARRLAALAPDEELSYLDRRRLRSHLRRCRACREFADAVDRITRALRDVSRR